MPRPTTASGRLSKKTPAEGCKTQGGLPHGEGGGVWSEEDEHRLALKPIIRKVWGPVGERPILRVRQRYEWTYLYAFARPNTGEEVHWLILPTVNAEVFSVALESFAGEVGVGKSKRILCSCSIKRGGTRQNKKPKVPEGIHLEFLPPHSPELQPSERLWPLSDEGVAKTATSSGSGSWRRLWCSDAWRWASSQR